MIDEFIYLTGLDFPIQYQTNTKASSIDDTYRLEVSLSRIYYLLNTMNLNKVRANFVMQPLTLVRVIRITHINSR